MKYFFDQQLTESILYSSSDKKFINELLNPQIPRIRKAELNLSIIEDMNHNKIDDVRNVDLSHEITSTLDHRHSNNNQIVKNIETHVLMNESLDLEESSTKKFSFQIQWWKNIFIKLYGYSNWLSNKIHYFFQINYNRIHKLFIPVISEDTITKHYEQSSNQLTEVISLFNKRHKEITLLINENFNNLTQEFNQVQVKNEKTLSILKCKLDILEEIVQRNSTISSQSSGSISPSATQLTSLTPLFSSLPSPPIPPPPPMPPVNIPIATIQNFQIHNQMSQHLSKRKCSTPLVENRPLITVEDLRKVTLKKAPQANKENNPKRYGDAPRGPAISLDMLRSVKLKSTRRNKGNADTKNIRSSRHALESCGTLKFSLSPITAGDAVSPLNRILKQVDNRQKCKESLMTPTHSDNDLTKNNPKNYDVSCRKTSSHTIIV